MRFMRKSRGRFPIGFARRLLPLSVFLVFLVLSAAACALAAARPDTLRVALATDMLTWDPHNYRTGQDSTMHNFVYETLVAHDRNNEPVPKLAVKWEKLDTQRWRFFLREGVRFTDGTAFDAEAAKISLERCSQAPRGSGFLGFIENVEVEGPHTIVINLKYPYGGILHNLSSPVSSIVSSKLIADQGEKLSSAVPAGTGPYKLKEWVPNNRVEFERNAGYWGQPPEIGNLRFSIIPEESTRLMALKGGEVHMIENLPPHEIEGIRSDKRFDVIMMPRARTVWLGMNYKSGPTADRRVREAISMAIDRDAIVDYVLEGVGIPAETFIPYCIFADQEKYPARNDLQAAKKLLEEAGYKDGFTVNFWTPEARYLKDKQVAEVIQQQLSKIGIRTNISVMEFGSYLAALGRHEGELFIIGWGFMTCEPTQALKQTMETGNAFNYSDYSEKDFDELLRAAEGESDPAGMKGLLDRINKKLIVDDSTVAMLYHMNFVFGATSALEGVYLTPNELIDLSEARFVE